MVADRRATAALHACACRRRSRCGPRCRRAPARRRRRADGISLALYPRHHYGTDGSDQVSFLVQGAATLARAGQRDPRIVDAALWSVALQGVLSYAVSGWDKLAGPSWRNGQALEGVTRTLDVRRPPGVAAFKAHPRIARAWAGRARHGVPVPVRLPGQGPGRRAHARGRPAFHVANARIMGLGRFVWSFMSMHPAVLYAAVRASAGPPRRAASRAATTRCRRSRRAAGGRAGRRHHRAGPARDKVAGAGR